ncbi:hypothetical protein BU16DRAFT_531076 [Lophium mytilinum]|uniref:Uncharacterized protein n=1 Tax=Lophium mytilinum TaxID=390894 RepID=A0A6A6QEZ8_9PEZI|nr:hypothetical protein BU16DRAFT_531076 [Lophium mytilinum]
MSGSDELRRLDQELRRLSDERLDLQREQESVVKQIQPLEKKTQGLYAQQQRLEHRSIEIANEELAIRQQRMVILTKFNPKLDIVPAGQSSAQETSTKATASKSVKKPRPTSKARGKAKSGPASASGLLHNLKSAAPANQSPASSTRWKTRGGLLAASPGTPPTTSPFMPEDPVANSATISRKRTRAVVDQEHESPYIPRKRSNARKGRQTITSMTAGVLPENHEAPHTQPSIPAAAAEEPTVENFTHDSSKWPTVVLKYGQQNGGEWVDLRCPECGCNAPTSGIGFFKGANGMKFHMMSAHNYKATESFILLAQTHTSYTTEQIFHLNTGGPLAPTLPLIPAIGKAGKTTESGDRKSGGGLVAMAPASEKTGLQGAAKKKKGHGWSAVTSGPRRKSKPSTLGQTQLSFSEEEAPQQSAESGAALDESQHARDNDQEAANGQHDDSTLTAPIDIQ